MNVIFFGTPEFAIPILEALVKEGHDIIAVITQPDKPAGRKQKLTPPPVKLAAQKLGLKILQPASLKNNNDIPTFLRMLECDLGVVAAYGKIIPQEILYMPKHSFINIHPSLLPKYRGPSPIQTALLNGITETGVTIMLVDEQIDHGPILAQKPYYLLPTTYYTQAEKELAEIGAKLLVETLPKYIGGEIKPKPQDHSQATFTKMFAREDGRINWSEPAEKIYNRIRALNPEPGTWTMWPASPSQGGKGKIINIKRTELVDGKLKIQTIQMEGKKEMPFKEFLNGYPDFDISQLN
mgnify:CR=1 FL=1